MRLQYTNRLALLLLLSACGSRQAGPVAERSAPPPPPNWRQMATDTDRERLRSWRDAWFVALGRARQRDSAKLDAQGELFDPDRALAGAVPPAGKYRCRVFKLGARGTAMAEFTRYPDFDCRVDDEGDVSGFYKLTGTQRLAGILFRDNVSRSVFLGSLLMGDERQRLQYGRDRGRDSAGYMERIGQNRWRLVLPYPQFESLLDVIELVPAP